MKITVLCENNSRIDNYLLAEAGLSFYIELDDKKILFDTGYSDVFFKNAQKLGINFNDLTDIVISHGHDDHTGGLTYMKPNKKVRLTAHPNMFDKRAHLGEVEYGCPISKNELEEKFTLNLTKYPFSISEKLFFLGEIESNSSKDVDDSALVYRTEKGLFIITGCSHSGIENIVNYAKKVLKEDRIYGILGGMHLLHMQEAEVGKISEFFSKNGVEYLAPCHCCDLYSKIILARKNKIEEICVGDEIVI